MDTRVPPQNLDAEQSILGGLMIEPEAWDEIADLVYEEDFYKPAHRKIFASIKSLQQKHQPTDLITVSNHLMSTSELEAIGGPRYLTELIDQTPSAANITTYANIVRDKALVRRLIHTSQGLIEKAYAQDFEDVSQFMDQVETEIFQLAEQRNTSGLTDASDLVKASLEKLQLLYEQRGQITGVPSGFTELDEMTAGFQPGELTIIAARPSMGKTAFSLNVAMAAAIREKKKVAYFSVEMAKESVMTRMLASEAKISLSDLRVGHLDDRTWPKLINTAATLSEAGIYIDDTSGISPFEIRAKARRLKARHGLDIIMVDYLQLMSLKVKVESREREVSEISKMLKAIAKELSVPVIALAQLNRGVEGRSDRRPMLSDLRESGSIEQDADIIMMLYREDYYDRDNPEVRGLAEVIIGKQRNGPTGAVKLRWVPEFGLFRDLVNGPDAPMPEAPPAHYRPPQGQNNSNSSKPTKGPDGKPRNFAPGATP